MKETKRMLREGKLDAERTMDYLTDETVNKDRRECASVQREKPWAKPHKNE